MNNAKVVMLVVLLLLVGVTVGVAMPNWVEEVVRQASGLAAPEDATAIVLYDVRDVEVSDSGKAKTKAQSAYKILTRGGQEFAGLSQAIYPFLKVKDLECWVVKPDGTSKKMDKDQVMTVGIQESAGYYDDSHVLIARPPDVEPGDIVAFEMELEEKGWTSFHQSFVFQVQQPVRFARFSLTVPEGWELFYGTWRIEGIDFAHEGNRHVWTAYDLEYQPEEPLAPSWYYLSRRIAVSCFDPEEREATNFADWEAVAGWCSDVYAAPSVADDTVIGKAAEMLGDAPTFEDKIRTVADFNQNEIRYVAIEIGKNRWLPRPAHTTLFNRFGDCKDKTVLMRAMLESIGIESVPVLCNPLYPVDPRVPTPFQFNHCIIAVPVEGQNLSEEFEDAVVGGWLFFDPTDQSIQVGQLPWALQGDRVLLATEADSVLLELPYPDPGHYRRIYSAKSQLNEDGSFAADVTVTDFHGAAALRRYRRRVTSEKEQIANWVSRLSKAVPYVEINDYQAGEDRDSVWVSFSIVGKHYVQETGGLSLLRPDLFHATSPPALTGQERSFPVWFGPPIEIVSKVRWELPQGWMADADTSAMRHECEPASIACDIAIDGNLLSIVTVYRRDGRVIWPDAYESARNFSRNLSQVRGQVAMIQKQ